MKIKSNGSITPNPFSIQQYNNNVDIKCFEIPRFYYGNTDSETDISELYDTNPVDLSKCSVVMRLSNPDDKINQGINLFISNDKGEDEFSDDDDKVIVNWIITNNVSDYAGKRTYQLEFYDGDVLAFRTQVMNFVVKESLDTESLIPIHQPTIFEEFEDKLNDIMNDTTNYTDFIVKEVTEQTNEVATSINNKVDNEISAIETKVNSVASGSPLVASSVSGMTDTSRTYVNTTDGKWYYYNGSNWVAGGVYQATGIADESVFVNSTDFITEGLNKFKGLNTADEELPIFYDKETGEISFTGKVTSSRHILLGEAYLKPGTYHYHKINSSGVAYYIKKDGAIVFEPAYSNDLVLEVTETGIYEVYMWAAKTSTYNHKIKIQIEPGDIFTSFEPYYNNFIYPYNMSTKFKNLTYLAIGDSLTQGFKSWTNELKLHEIPYPLAVKNKLGLKESYNRGLSGSILANDTSISTTYLPMSNDVRMAEYENADIISIMGGTNDKLENVVLGDITSTDETTYYGGYKKLIEYLLTNNPNSFIFLITQPCWGEYGLENANGNTVNNYVNATIEIGRYYGIPVFDLNANTRYGYYQLANGSVPAHFTQEYILNTLTPMLCKFIENNYLG